MGNKLDCRIVQDLLPTYIEGLTSEVTNKTLEEHLSSCAECKAVLHTMTNEMKEMNRVPQKQINFLKKIKRRQWIIAACSVVVAVTIFASVFYFISQRQFAVPSSEVKISEVYQMKDGSVHYRIDANVTGYLGNVFLRNDGDSEVIRIYEHRRLFSDQDRNKVSIPERWVPLKGKEITSIIYEGNGKNDRVIIWEKGMVLPKADAEQEAEYERSSGKQR